jgi:predicted nucleic acid-binding Zn ribbon protein
MKPRREPRPLKEVMPELLRSMGVRPANKLKSVKEAWQAAGGSLSSRARVASLKSGVLTLAVESPTVRFEIESVRQGELLASLQALLPDRAVTRIRCVLL